MIDWYTDFDEINAELREMSLQSGSVENNSRLYVGSGEDFDIRKTFGSPNRLFSTGEYYE